MNNTGDSASRQMIDPTRGVEHLSLVLTRHQSEVENQSVLNALRYDTPSQRGVVSETTQKGVNSETHSGATGVKILQPLSSRGSEMTIESQDALRCDRETSARPSPSPPVHDLVQRGEIIKTHSPPEPVNGSRASISCWLRGSLWRMRGPE